jgi:hypothetical protein
MKLTTIYRDCRGRIIDLIGLDAEERQLVQTLLDRAESHPDWNDFSNFWMANVGEFYKKRGLDRRTVTKLPAFLIGQDLASRIAIAAGFVRVPDYRDDLQDLIRTRYRTQREFCEATGLSEDMLSHVLSKRKHLAIDTLAEALEKVGYKLNIVPIVPPSNTAA